MGNYNDLEQEVSDLLDDPLRPMTIGAVLAHKHGTPSPKRTRGLWEIASDIRRHWPKVNYAAVPCLEAMYELNSIDDDFYADSGKSVVLYFLSNVSSWRGEDARRIKKELKAMVR